MSGDKMEVELAEQKMNSMEHSEQHYFKRLVLFLVMRGGICALSCVAFTDYSLLL